MFVLAHLSDPHLQMPAPPGLLELAGKRAIGYINWQRGRHTIHRTDIAAELVADLLRHKPDHIAMTGDLVNVAARCEWAAARAYMQALGTPEGVTAVPGNHDAYVRSAIAEMDAVYAPYVTPDADANSHASYGGAQTPTYPFVRRRGPLALVGVSTAVATLPFMATGWLGRRQLADLDATLERLADSGLFRVLLIHHPPTAELAHGRRGLSDADALAPPIARHGVDLILHGHNHTATLAHMPGPAGPVPIVGVPSASARPTQRKPGAGYALFEISGSPGVWQVTMVRRGLSPRFAQDGTVEVVELERRELACPGYDSSTRAAE